MFTRILLGACILFRKAVYIIDVKINRKNIELNEGIHVVYISITCNTRFIPTDLKYFLWTNVLWTKQSLRQQQEEEIVPEKHDICVLLIKTWHLWLNSAQTNGEPFTKAVWCLRAYLCHMSFSFTSILRPCRTLYIR